MKVKNIKQLGTQYNVLGDEGQLVKVIRVLKYDDILNCGVGIYHEDQGSFNEYLERSKKCFKGFAESPLKVHWHTIESHEEFDIMDVIDVCLERDYDYAIVETIDYEEE